ncbi:hypothetical protein [Candidatus Entotheonella palauensis]|uniref:Uncharacterized protein n=1 Tax=Candidatus Entotheonella gemina TaxID=1429439 RepID=W4L9P5_9BACT|nr:hypothetical protein [Candidatus Entotheonella palauensis]ETW94788.1 MAG: hypothetical protein ETSY2_49170 [Candidatus Entotheonella gemina]
MPSVDTGNGSNASGFIKWGSFISGLCALVGSLLVTLQSPQMNPPYPFDVIQTRVDAFVR